MILNSLDDFFDSFSFFEWFQAREPSAGSSSEPPSGPPAEPSPSQEQITGSLDVQTEIPAAQSQDPVVDSQEREVLDGSGPFISYMRLMDETSAASVSDWTSQDIAELHATIGDVPTSMSGLGPAGDSGA